MKEIAMGGQAPEDSLGKMKLTSARECTKMKVMASSRSRKVFTSKASKVKQGFKTNGIRLGTSIPNNITIIVELRKDIRL